jgi:hypothetical protein
MYQYAYFAYKLRLIMHDKCIIMHNKYIIMHNGPIHVQYKYVLRIFGKYAKLCIIMHNYA